MGNRNMVDRALGYGCAGIQVDGNDVVQCWGAAREAVARGRSGGGPTLIEVKTYRRKGHAEHDDQRYVSKEELETWETRDPVARYERWLLGQGIVDQQQLEQIDARVRRKLDAAVEEAEKAPMPEPRTALDDVWSTPRWPHASPNYHDFTKEVVE
jgi:TPP-dependent pyruvate/acetoin dehydrogenase alpha subunit